MPDSCRVMLVVGAGLFVASSAHAQKLPVPGQKNLDWSLQKTEEVQSAALLDRQPIPAPMPNGMQEVAKYYESEELKIIYDPRRGMRYNMSAIQQGFIRVQNLQTGTVYTYVRKGVVAPYNQK